MRTLTSLIGAALLLAASPVFAAETIEAKVNGMVCALCAKGIEEALAERSGVAKVHVDLDTKLVRVVLKDGGALSDAELQEIITDAGYALVGVSRTQS
jgi:mercuric ion binding protein